MREVIVAGVLIAVLSGCAGGGGEQVTGTTGARQETTTGQETATGQETTAGVEAGVLKGRVVDAEGRPIAGAEIVADNQFLHNSNLVVMTDADGRYRVSTNVATATFQVSGTVTRRFEGRVYTMQLTPHDDTSFAGPTGAIRDFTWRLTGERPDGLGFYGSLVLFNMDVWDLPNPDEYLREEDVTLTLTPQGPLIDGSAGEVITRRAERTADGPGLTDIPIGRYRITAESLGRPLRIRLRDTGEYAEAVDTVFEKFLTTSHRIELDLKP
ncbi:carboxypeptidase-like regulatory domain-containing protein [Sphaerisporangium sp. NPDC049002]|uniref:carboxypeptidase-like regulatory domain-containing protein n=1 Tax=Sphaerisporangium sp. NPDC049002 TaxID=3155392 RepID=UPI0034089157